MLLLKLTVPVVGLKVDDDPSDTQNWNRLLNSVHIFTGPVFGILLTGGTFISRDFTVLFSLFRFSQVCQLVLE